jgi:hypothetical protein
MKKTLSTLIVLITLFTLSIPLYDYLKNNEYVVSIIEYYTKDHSSLTQNEYSKYTVNNYFNLTTNFDPRSKKDLLDIYYTVLSSGMNEFVFYCPSEYVECIDDIKDITSDNMLLSHMNSFTHVFNSYKSIKTEYKNNGKITIKIIRAYDQEMIDKINKKVDEIYNSIVDETKSTKVNITKIHDYIINNSKYDVEYVNDRSKHQSNNAYGPLFEGYAICSGYTDLMALYLDKLGLENYKISNEEHIWNIVYFNNQWLHIDVTYDDPIVSTGENYLRDDYLLITTEKLKLLDDDHIFDENIYLKKNE